MFDAQVVNKKTGRNVGGLSKREFKVHEDGGLQQITHFSQDSLPLSIVLLVDVSASVWPVMGEIQAGALQALQHLKPEDEIALMAFAANAELVQDFTKDRSLITDKIRQIEKYKSGGTFIDEAVYQAAATLNRSTNPDSRRVIIAITDNESNQPAGTGHSEQEATEELLESGSVVCGLILDSYTDKLGKAIKYYPPYFVLERVFRKKLQRMRGVDRITPHSNETGGIVVVAKKKETVAKLTQLIDRLRSRYSFGYVSSNQKRDGTFRTIKVSISPEVEKREGRVAIITRKGYYARRSDNTTR